MSLSLSLSLSLSFSHCLAISPTKYYFVSTAEISRLENLQLPAREHTGLLRRLGLQDERGAILRRLDDSERSVLRGCRPCRALWGEEEQGNWGNKEEEEEVEEEEEEEETADH